MVKKSRIFPILFGLAALGSLAVGGVRAQESVGKEREPQGLEQDFLLRVWETADGLLPTNVRSIAQTPDGYVWLAAFDGFVRFDGVRAVLFSPGRVCRGFPPFSQRQQSICGFRRATLGDDH